jgi:type I restriction enzyme S subunit
VKYYEGRFNAYQRTYFLFSRDEKNCYPRFLFWFLENHLDVLRSGASGSTIKYIRLGDLADAKMPVPPLEEQKQIVARLDLMRAKTSEMVATYDAKLTAAKNLRQSILEAAFAGAL